MAKQSTPFDPMDMLRLFDPSQALNEWRRLLESYGVPKGVELPAMLDSQRKNMEALMEANRLLLSGAQAVLQRQTELLTEATQEAAKAAGKLTGTQQPAELQQQQMQLIAGAYGRAISVLQEISGMVNASQQQALKVLNQRWNDSINELRTLGGQAGTGGKGTS